MQQIKFMTQLIIYQIVSIHDNIIYMYASLDNSVRANMNNHPLYKRI